MAKLNIQKPLIDASVAIAGAGLLDTFVVKNVQMIGDLMAQLPVIQGISVASIVLGATALVVFRNYIMK